MRVVLGLTLFCNDAPFYKRIAKPRKALPRMAARPMPAPGIMEGAAPELLLKPGAEVGVDPPNPVTGILLVPEAEAVRDMVVGREVLPR